MVCRIRKGLKTKRNINHNTTKMKPKHIFLLLLFLVITSLSAFPVTIYVAPSGTNTNPGTAELPFATLNAALQHVRDLRIIKGISEPVEIIVLGGTYLLTQPLVFTPEDSGSELAPLIIKGQYDSPPVFSGGLKLAAFEKVTDKLWKTYIPEIALFGGSVQQLFVNGERVIRARTPDTGSLFKTKSASETKTDSRENSMIRTSVQKIDLTTAQADVLESIPVSEIQNIIINIHHAWDRTRKYIWSFSSQDSSVYITGQQMHVWNTLDNTSQFFFENSKAFLDSPGEWYLEQNGSLYYMPKDGETIENSTAIVPVLDRLVVIGGEEGKKVENIRFENLSFLYTRYTMPFQGNEPSQAAAFTEAAVMVDYARNIQFLNCEISHTGTNAIWFRRACSDCNLTHSYIHDLGVGAVKIGERQAPKDERLTTRNITIHNNILRSGSHEFPTGVGVLIFSSGDNTISNNEIADFGYSGVSVGWVWGYKESAAVRNKIIFNHIHHLGWGELSDMGGVYTLGPSVGTIVSNNVIHHIYSYGYGGWGIYTDEGSTGILIENNLVYECKSSGFHQHYGKDNIIRNNIFANQIKGQLEATRTEDHQSFSFTNNIVYFDRGNLIGQHGWKHVKFEADYNCYWDSRTKDISFEGMNFGEWKKTTGKDQHSIVADPGFKDPSAYNFEITNKSILSKIRFNRFDYSKAGVYGDSAWKKLSEFDPEIATKYNAMVKRRISEGEPQKKQ